MDYYVLRREQKILYRGTSEEKVKEVLATQKPSGARIGHITLYDFYTIGNDEIDISMRFHVGLNKGKFIFAWSKEVRAEIKDLTTFLRVFEREKAKR